ncbi:TonB-dependent hemoglobin/transferrin/lactoferrin family receptor [Psychrobacter sp. I-STPA6b]|uniref:TonB-dependent hemoglobin/transferrin/lactoferrin family receptor n=1 Tax=Psychrobacter sp. I-STPA6b TaxID=2585718 RepID=UPI001D0CA330|nr:TonB-dependent hemoglobin/transferrin/lactoferrin family receptor [Psychrobacter sp. I-STPA6b]
MNSSFNSNALKAIASPNSAKCTVGMFIRSPLSIVIGLLMSQTALAEEAPTVELEEVVISAGPRDATEASKKVVTAKDIQDNQINSQKDLVRYNPEVSVAEVGRYGSKGFAIRGVDGNRVAMSYDGVSLPDQQINELFSPYGYMYEGRFSPDTEMLSDVDLQVGADSFSSGSGAVGGAVNYKSKDPVDLLHGSEQIGGYVKTGYTSKNEEAVGAVGLAGKVGKFEALINYAYREGHELKNHRMLPFNKDKLNPAYDFEGDPDYRYPQDGTPISDKAAILPDPQHYESHAALAKLYYHPSEEHRIGIQGSYQYSANKSNHFTKNTTSDRRIGYDEGELKGVGVNYRYLPFDSQWIDEVKADVNYQHIIGAANTYVYSQPYTADLLWINEYRPQYDTTTQLNVEGHLLPIETGSLGSHTVSVVGSYANTDHELILKEWNKFYKAGDYGFKFLGPSVKKDVYSVAIADDIKVNDKLNAKIGIRYDNHHYQPYMTDIDTYAINHTGQQYVIRLQYEKGDLTKPRRMSNLGGLLALNYKLTPHWQAGYKVSTGFLAPSLSQMYSAYNIQGVTLTTNPHLNPEKSLNHELSLQGNFDTFSVNTTGFYTDYSDFIKTVYHDKITECDKNGQNCTEQYGTFVSAENIGKAKTYGVRLGGVWDISKIIDINGQLKLTGDISYAKDSSDKGINLLATEPLNGVLGLEYHPATDDYQLHAKMRYVGAKKPEDAKVIDKYNQLTPYEHIDASKSTFVYDLYGSKSFDNGFKFSAGIYNVFDQKYIPWSNLRMLADLNVNTMVDDKGRGLERYTAPGRNYAVALTYEF